MLVSTKFGSKQQEKKTTKNNKKNNKKTKKKQQKNNKKQQKKQQKNNKKQKKTTKKQQKNMKAESCFRPIYQIRFCARSNIDFNRSHLIRIIKITI